MASPIKMKPGKAVRKPMPKPMPKPGKKMLKPKPKSKVVAQGDENQREAFNAIRGTKLAKGTSSSGVGAKVSKQSVKKTKGTWSELPNARNQQRMGGKGK
jgi:hypothetical protein